MTEKKVYYCNNCKKEIKRKEIIKVFESKRKKKNTYKCNLCWRYKRWLWNFRFYRVYSYIQHQV